VVRRSGPASYAAGAAILSPMLLPLLVALAASPLAPLPPQQPPPPPGDDEPRGLRSSAEGAFEGYTLFAPLSSGHTLLVDMQGREVHRWDSTIAPSAVYLLEDGSILRCGHPAGKNPVFSGGGMCGRIERISWDGEVLWTYELSDEYQTQHHDARPMPNGHVLLITWEFRYREDCIAAGRDPLQVGEKGLWPDAVLEVAPTPPEGGEIVWEWHAWDHLVQDRDPDADFYGVVAEHPGRIDINYDHRDAEQVGASVEEQRKRAELEAQMRALGYTGGDDEEEPPPPPAGNPPLAPLGQPGGHGSDWLHTNAIDYNPELDLIVLSSPHLSEIWIIDHSTTAEQAAGRTGGTYGHGGEILWRWGNPANHGAGTPADRRLFYQHNVQWIPPGRPGAGHLLVFNNGQDRPGGEHSSVDELELPLEVGHGFRREGAAFDPVQPVWSYSAGPEFFAPFISGCQRLPNGNTLICEGPKGRVFEVTPDGRTVWDFWNPVGGDLQVDGVTGKALFRATRIAPDHPALRGRELTPREQ